LKILPSIDLYGGKIIRLYQGKFNNIKVYERSPLEITEFLKDLGYKDLQVIDLEGAQKGNPVHADLVKELASTGLRIFFGGGLRSAADIETAFKHGAEFVYSGSLLIKNISARRELFKKWGNRIIPAVDIRNRKVALSGWQSESDTEMMEIFSDLYKEGFRKYLVTAVLQDGTMEGPDISLYTRILSELPQFQLIAAGGVSSLQDIAALARTGCWAAVTGKAFLEGHIDLSEAKKVASSDA